MALNSVHIVIKYTPTHSSSHKAGYRLGISQLDVGRQTHKHMESLTHAHSCTHTVTRIHSGCDLALIFKWGRYNQITQTGLPACYIKVDIEVGLKLALFRSL